MAHGQRLACFAVVGGSGVAVNTALLLLLVEVAGLPHVAAAALATEAAILWNFALNDRWTFRDLRAGATWAHRAARYNAVALGGLAVSVAVLATLVAGWGLHYAVANLCAIASATLWNYSVNAWLHGRRPATHSLAARG